MIFWGEVEEQDSPTLFRRCASYEEGARRVRSAKHKGDGQIRTVYKAAQQSQLKQASVTRVLLADAGGVDFGRSLLSSHSSVSCRL